MNLSAASHAGDVRKKGSPQRAPAPEHAGTGALLIAVTAAEERNGMGRKALSLRRVRPRFPVFTR